MRRDCQAYKDAMEAARKKTKQQPKVSVMGKADEGAREEEDDYDEEESENY